MSGETQGKPTPGGPTPPLEHIYAIAIVDLDKKPIAIDRETTFRPYQGLYESMLEAARGSNAKLGRRRYVPAFVYQTGAFCIRFNELSGRYL